MRPAFIGLGAQKCASTWLHRLLESHPEVALPAVKELDFFSHHFDSGFQWYERQFLTPNVPSAPCAGEISPSYFHHAQAPARVRAYAPDVRLLLTLRDPVERALSNHRHEVRLGRFRGDDLSFEAGLANNPMYVEQGCYATHLASWLACFPLQQVYVALVEDVRNDPWRVARDVFRFLGVDPCFRSEAVEGRFNSSYAHRSRTLGWVKDRAYALTRTPGLAWTWTAAKTLGARYVYRHVNVVDSDRLIPPPLPDTLRTLRRRFAPEVRRLESLLDRDLCHWLDDGDRADESVLASAASAVAGDGP